MTCIAAIKHEGKVYMGSDSQVSCGSLKLNGGCKVFIKGSMIIGSSGFSRFEKILKHNFNIPEHNNSLSDTEYLNSVFVDTLRELCDKKQYLKVLDSRSGISDTTLIGYNGEIYKMSCDFDVSTYNMDYFAVGSGDDFAMGSLFSTITRTDMEPEYKIEIAIGAACYFDDGCSGKINVLSI